MSLARQARNRFQTRWRLPAKKGVGSLFQNRPSRKKTPDPFSGADDAGAGEAVVDTTMIAAQYGKEPQAGGGRQHKPHQLPEERAAKVERGARLSRHHFNPCGHFPERLT